MKSLRDATALVDLQTVVESLPAGACLLDAGDFRVVAHNQVYQEMQAGRYGGDGLVGLRIQDFVPLAEELGVLDLYRKAAAGETVSLSEYAFQHETRGETCWDVHLAPIRDDQGQVRWILATMSDVTERKRAEEQLQQLSRAVEQSPTTIVVTDAHGNIEYANPKFVSLTGYTLEEAIGHNPRILKSGLTPRETYKNMWDTIRAGNVWQGEFCNKKKNGELYWESATISPIRNSDGVITNFVAVKEDITERKKAEQFREEYLSLISHDLRAPLTAIIGNTQLLRRSLSTSEDKHLIARADATLAAGKRMNAMLQDLVESVRLESGGVVLHRESVSLSYLVFGVLERAIPPDQVNRIQIEAPDNLPEIQMDPAHLERVLVNLLTNALKYSPQEQGVDIRLEQRDNEVLVSVTDRGVGISEDDLPHLFERFFRAKTRGAADGIGLGLYISRMLVGAHGGRIWAESSVGIGSIFHFTLPVV